MDTLTKEKRSWNMSRIRSADTKPELIVRSFLHSIGFRFRLKNPVLPGNPDIILPRFKSVIFVHGCFWHRHKGCKYAYDPKTRVEFWQNKFAANVRRDENVAQKLKTLEWNQLILWECEIKNREIMQKLIKVFFYG